MQNKKKRDRGFSTRHPFLANCILVVSSTVLAILVVDLVAYNLFDSRRLGTGSRQYFQFSRLLGWEHRPNADGTWYAYKDGTRTHVKINP
jgi:hypothetical protein